MNGSSYASRVYTIRKLVLKRSRKFSLKTSEPAGKVQCHVTLIGLRFRQVHSSFATFVVAPTQRGHTIIIINSNNNN